MNILRTNIDGKEYKVFLTHMNDKPIVFVRVVRVLENGERVDAFLSARQHKAENRARSTFANEIKEHMGTR